MQSIIIIGGGISGLTTAYFLQQQAAQLNLPLTITLIEKEPRLGGKICSNHERGFICEYGPNGFLSTKAETLALCHSLGIADQLLLSNHDAQQRFIFDQHKLSLVANKPLKFFSSSLISWPAKLRLLSEFFITAKRGVNDESIADFSRRHFGAEVLAKLIAPGINGIFAGDPEQLSLKACFPLVHKLEQSQGSLMKVLLKQAFIKKPVSQLMSLTGGMQGLIAALTAAVGPDNVISNTAVMTIKPDASGLANWQVNLANGQLCTATHVICTTPAYATAELVADFASKLALTLQSIEYVPLVVACLGYFKRDLARSLNGFGYLTTNQPSPILGSVWESSVFANRAPQDQILMRVMLGGSRDLAINDLNDMALYQVISKHLALSLGVNASPALLKIYRHARAIPQYKLGHLQLVAQIMQLANSYPGLFIGGNSYYGVSVNDCILNAANLAKQVIASINGHKF